MPKAVVLTCLAPEVKEMFTQEMEAIEDNAVRQVFAELVGAVADCPEGQALGVEIHESALPEGRRKRKPSAFNNFVAECARGGAKTLTECAAVWRTMSDEQKAAYKSS